MLPSRAPDGLAFLLAFGACIAHPGARAAVTAAIALIVAIAWFSPAPAAVIWTDGDADGLPDSSPLPATQGDLLSVDVWIDTGTFTWTNYLIYVEWGAGCLSFASGEYYVSGGTNFPIDTFSHPSGAGFGGYDYNNGGVERMVRVDLTSTAPVTCCVTPIIDPKSPYGVFSQVGSGETYLLFDENPGTCWQSAPRLEACCFVDGSCQDLIASDCADAGGSPGPAGSSCATYDCEAVGGACCYPDGACASPVSREYCESVGGAYQGNGTHCGLVACPLPTGACCYVGGSCSDDIDQEACTAGGGDYQGDGSTCADSCAFSTGACCLPNGTCTTIYTRDQCLGFGGTFIGPNTTCAGVSCEVFIGACCFADGYCENRVEETCVAGGGVFQGAGTTCINVQCPQPAVACCFDSGDCADLTIEACQAAGGAPQPYGTSCATFSCPVRRGACCVDAVCTPDVIRSECLAMGGVYVGDGMSCEGVSCLTGACCFNGGPCRADLIRSQCIELGGSYQGDGTICDSVSCNVPCPTNVSAAPFPMRESLQSPSRREMKAPPCLLSSSTNGTAANYRWYNVCSGYIWIFPAWDANEGVGVLYGGAGNPAVAASNDVKRTITYYRNVCPGYNQTVDVYLDNATSAGCITSNIASDLNLDPGLRWNCSEFNVRLCSTSGYVVVRTQHDGGGSPSFVTDGPFSSQCDPNSPARSYYYGLNGSACVPWLGPDNGVDNFLNWLIIDAGSPCTTAIQSTSWGKIKGLFR